MKKLVYILSCLFLLSAGFVACSSETDDPPEQPSSHQNETPVDSASVEKDTTEVDSTAVPPIITYSKEWVYEGQLTSTVFFTDHYYIDGDTVIEGKECMLLFSERKHVYSGIPREEKRYEGALYEEGEKVFFIPANDTEFHLLYDYGLQVGEKAEVLKFDDAKSTITVTVTDVKTITINNHERRILHFSCNYPYDNYGGIWIEGVGGMQTLVPLRPLDGFGKLLIKTMKVEGESIEIGKMLREQQRSGMMAYKPMLIDGRVWRFRSVHYEDDDRAKKTVSVLDCYLDGDTLIGGKTWRKMYYELNGSRSYSGAWLEEDMKVYTINKGKSEEDVKVMFEFNMLPYEFSHYEGDGHKCFTHTDTIDVNGVLYLRHNFLDPTQLEPGKECYVEGIGGMEGLSPFYLPSPTCLCDYSVFESVYDGDKCIFTTRDFYK